MSAVYFTKGERECPWAAGSVVGLAIHKGHNHSPLPPRVPEGRCKRCGRHRHLAQTTAAGHLIFTIELFRISIILPIFALLRLQCCLFTVICVNHVIFELSSEHTLHSSIIKKLNIWQ